MSIAVMSQPPAPEELVALAEWRLNPDDNMAEVAFLVRDEWQRRGLGRLLLDYLIELAMERGIAGFTAEVLATNQAMLHVFQQCRQTVRTHLAEGTYSVVIEFDRDEVKRRTEAAGQPHIA